MEVNKTFRFFGLGLILLMTLNTGCYYNKTPLPPEPEGDISYSTQVQPIWNSNCTINCHTPGTGVPLILDEGVSYDNIINGNYVNTEDPSASSLYVKITPGQSMEQYANDSERAIILKWIEQGALNN